MGKGRDLRHESCGDCLEKGGDRDGGAGEETADAAAEGEEAGAERANGEEALDEDEGEHEARGIIVGLGMATDTGVSTALKPELGFLCEEKCCVVLT